MLENAQIAVFDGIIDQFGRKGCQKKRKDVSYALLKQFFQNYFGAYERRAVKNSFSAYLCTKGFYSCGVNCR